MSKSRTREARERRQKQRQQNQQRLILAGIVIVAIVVIALIIVSNQPTEAPIPAGAADTYAGLQRSESEEGYPRIGDPDAPVKVDEYSSFACSHCADFHESTLPAIIARVRTGEVLFTYKPMLTGGVPNAEGAARTGLCAAQQGKFWEMHETLFDWHVRFGNSAFTQARLLAGVAALGLDSNAFNSCFNSASVTKTINAASSEGVSATPTIKVNNVEVDIDTASIMDAIDAAIPSGWVPPTDTSTQDAEATEAVDSSAEATEAVETTAEATEAVETTMEAVESNVSGS